MVAGYKPLKPSMQHYHNYMTDHISGLVRVGWRLGEDGWGLASYVSRYAQVVINSSRDKGKREGLDGVAGAKRLFFLIASLGDVPPVHIIFKGEC